MHLGNLPPEMVQAIASHADVRSLVSLASPNRQVRGHMQPELQAGTTITEDVPRVRTSNAANSLLGRIQQELPPPFQGKPLAALGAQIMQLSDREQDTAMAAFLPVARSYQGPRPALLCPCRLNFEPPRRLNSEPGWRPV